MWHICMLLPTAQPLYALVAYHFFQSSKAASCPHLYQFARDDNFNVRTAKNSLILILVFSFVHNFKVSQIVRDHHAPIGVGQIISLTQILVHMREIDINMCSPTCPCNVVGPLTWTIHLITFGTSNKNIVF
jgi:hypothetical protein